MRNHFRKNYFIIFLILCNTIVAYGQKNIFQAEFAPTSPVVTAQESELRYAQSLNGSWKFKPVDEADKLTKEQIKNPKYPDQNNWENTPVKVPSTWNVNNFATDDIAGGDYVAYPSYPKRWEQVRAGWLMRKLEYRKEWKNKRLILHFEGVGGFSQVYLNKRKIAENFDVFLPFEVDITGMLEADKENELCVWSADGKLLDEPGKYGRRVFVAGSFWGQHVRGIWQDVNLLVKPEVYVSETFIQPMVDRDTLSIQVTLNNTTAKPRKINLSGEIFPWINLAGKSTIEAPEIKWKLGDKVLDMKLEKVKIPANGIATLTLKIKVDSKLKLWSSEMPNLYGIVLTPIENGKALDKKYTRFGWRQFLTVGNQLMLNGKPIILKGDSWHFMGMPQMTRRYAWAWFTALKNANGNAVRLHAQPYPSFYLDMADEMGIAVLDETGIWASDGGPKIDGEEYWARSEEHLKRLILRDRNHPAVFGWSVCNETLAVAINVFNAPDQLVKRQIAEINKWVAITRQMDPTRNWISGDGETNEPTDLPTVVGHYGGPNEYKDWSSQNKPWGIGEAGMAYYGTPKQTAEFNGDRSYRSQQGRMEGVAIEATKLLNQQKKYNASYRSIFNLVWYGLQPLEFGLADTTRKPIASDGIFFGNYVEGKGGVQPERLGPYTSTLNPGYDPNLPLYKTWPLFDAMKSGFADSQVAEQPEPVIQPKKNRTIRKKNLILLSSDPDSTLARMFSEVGLNVSKKIDNSPSLLVVDGLFPPTEKTATSIKDQVIKNGGTVLIWGISDESKDKVNPLLPKPIQLTQREANSFIINGANPILDNLTDADFYFSELSDKPLSYHGIDISSLTNKEVLLRASNTDWTKWNKQAEYLKTAAILRSEREKKQNGNVLIYIPEANGAIYLTSLDPRAIYKASPSIIANILGNLGVSANKKITTQRNNLGKNGFIEKALFLGPFWDEYENNKEFIQKDILADADSTAFVPGGNLEGRIWKSINANADHALTPLNLEGNPNSVGYYSFWIYSPRSLSNLLLEPDMPKIDMYIQSKNAVGLDLNGRMLTKVSENKGTNKIAAIPLEKGWNLIKIKTIKTSEDWKIGVQLTSNNPGFLTKEIKGETYR